MKRVIFAVTAWCIVSLAGAASADPVAITSGSITATNQQIGNGAADFFLSGSGFSLTGVSTDGLASPGCNFSTFATPGGSCTPTVTMSNGYFSSATIGDQSFQNVGLAGYFSVSGTVAIPKDLAGPTTLTFPFTVTAGSFLRGESGTMGNPVQQFSIPLSGSGTGTLSLGMTPGAPGQNPIFYGNGLSFTFGSSSPSPTPEPASLLLLGTGLAAVIGRRLRA